MGLFKPKLNEIHKMKLVLLYLWIAGAELRTALEKLAKDNGKPDLFKNMTPEVYRRISELFNCLIGGRFTARYYRSNPDGIPQSIDITIPEIPVLFRNDRGIIIKWNLAFQFRSDNRDDVFINQDTLFATIQNIAVMFMAGFRQRIYDNYSASFKECLIQAGYSPDLSKSFCIKYCNNLDSHIDYYCVKAEQFWDTVPRFEVNQALEALGDTIARWFDTLNNNIQYDGELILKQSQPPQIRH